MLYIIRYYMLVLYQNNIETIGLYIYNYNQQMNDILHVVICFTLSINSARINNSKFTFKNII